MNFLKWRLPSGRILAYHELGSPEGIPLVFYHGFPGSSVQASLIEDESVYQPFRLIAVDRPGFGESDPDPDRSIQSFAEDIVHLMEGLGLSKFHVLGVSGGAPYALGCAFFYPEKVLSVTAVSGLGPLSEIEFLSLMPTFTRNSLKLIRKSKYLSQLAMSLLHKAFTRASEAEGLTPPKFFLKGLATADQKLILDERLRKKFRSSMKHSFRNGAQGAARDLQLMTQNWEVDFSQLSMPVRFWHGSQDTIVPHEHSLRLAKKIKSSEVKIFENEGHYSVPLNCFAEILKPLQK